jgi:hypothetical protein
MSRCRWSIRPSLALLVALAGVPLSLSQAGCGGGGGDTAVTAEQPAEVQQANNAMEDFMKSKAASKKGGS